jgi:hypothetical protein
MNKFHIPAVLVAGSFAVQAFGQASVSAGTLNITTGAGDDAFFVLIGPAAGSVTLEGVRGVVDGTTFLGVSAINVNTNAGSDKVYVIQEGASLPALTVNTGTGEGLFELDMRIPATAAALTSRVRYIAGSAKDSFNARVESQANDLSLDWTTSMGEGQNEVLASVISDAASRRLAVRHSAFSGLGADKTQFDIDCKTARLETTFLGSMGGGDDEVILNAKGSGTTSAIATADFSLGLGNDKALFEFNEMSGTQFNGSVRGNDGSDILEARFGSLMTGAPTFDGGLGNDTLHFFVNGTIAGSPRLLAGAGDDLVEMLGVRATGAPFSDGGIGFDYFKGIGRRVNFEVIN